MESRLKMIMAEGLRRIRGPFYNADDYPSLLMPLISIAAKHRQRKTHMQQQKCLQICIILIKSIMATDNRISLVKVLKVAAVPRQRLCRCSADGSV